MLSEDKENKLIEVFIQADDFCQALDRWLESQEHPRVIYQGRMSVSELLAILVFYHHSGYKCFQYYYEEMILCHLKSYFPSAVSYKHFLSLIPRCQTHLLVWMKVICAQARPANAYYVDSKKLPVCDNLRIHNHCVFQGIAQRGKSSTGWFYGFKLHLVINNLGDIAAFELTPANVSDNQADLLRSLFKKLHGNCYGDKGYLTSIFEELYANGLRLITKIRKNMKNTLLPLLDRYWLFKRGIIESVNDILMTVCNVEHTRHRSPHNAFTHILGSLIAYSFLDQKPAVDLTNLIN